MAFSQFGTHRSRRHALLLGCSVAAVMTSLLPVLADDVEYDAVPGLAGVQAGFGIWDLTTFQNWTTDAGSSNQLFVDGDNVSFNAAGGGTINITTVVAPASLSFTTTGYTLAGDTAADGFNGTGGFTLTDDAGSNTISAGIDGSGGVGVIQKLGTETTTFSGSSHFNIDFDIDAGGILNAGSIFGDVDVAVGTTFDNDGSVANVTSSGTVENSSSVTGTATVNAGTFTNQSGGSVGSADVDGGTFDNENGATVTGTVSVDVGTFNNESGSSVQGTLTLNSGTVNNDSTVAALSQTGGTFENNNGASVTGTTSLTGGNLNNDSGAMLQGNVTNNGGTFTNNGSAGNLSNISGTTTNNATVNSVDLDGGTFNNENGATVTTTASVAGGIFNNKSGAGVTGTLTHTGGTVNNDGTVGSLAQDGGTFENNSGASVTGTSGVTGGNLNNDAGATLQGNVTVNGGTLTNAGQVDGTTTISSGSASNSGTMTGLVTVNGSGAFANTGTVSNGLAHSSTGSSSLEGTVNGTINHSNGTLSLTDNLLGDGIFNISGSGVVETNDFSLSGFTQINNGTTGTINDALGIASGTVLDNDGTVSGNVTSSGTVNNSGAMNGFVTVNDGTTTNEATGSMAGPRVNGGLFVNNGTVVGTSQFNGGTATNNGTLTGAVTVNGGTLNSTGTISNGLTIFSGTANVSGTVNGAVSSNGTISLLGNVSGDDLFDNNGTFSTNGFDASGFDWFIQQDTLDMADGTVNDSLSVTTGFDHSNPSSIWNINVDNANDSDVVNVVGFVSLDGTLNVTALGLEGDYTDPDYTYTIIDNDAVDPVTGSFSTINVNFAFLDPTIDYAGGDGNDVLLTLTPTGIDLNPFADTGNQGNFAMTMDDFDYSGTDGQEVQNGFNALTNGQVENAINQTSGENLLSNNGFGAVGQFNNAVQNGSSDVGGFGDVLNYAHSGDTADKMDATFDLVDGSDPLPEKEFDTRFWAKAFGGYGKVDGDSTAEGFANAFGGIAAGIEVLSRIHRAAVSIGGGYSHGWHDIDNSDSDITSDSFHGGLSASLGSEVDKGEGLGARFAASFSHHHYDSKRDITFGALNRTAEADYSGHTLSANMNLRYGIAFGETETTTMTFAPIAGIQLLAGRNDDFSETGAGTLNLTVEADDYDSAQTKLGIELASQTYAGMTKIKTQIIAAWLHELGDTEMTSTNTIAGSPTSYVVSTPELPEDLFALTTRVAAHFANGIAFSLSGDAEWSKASESYAGEARLSLPM